MKDFSNKIRFLTYVFYHSVILRQQLLSHWRFVQKYQWQEKSIIDELQKRKLKKLLLHCYSHVPYYHKLFSDKGVDENSFQQQSVFTIFNMIPFLTKKIIRENYNVLKAQNMSKREYRKNSTSGSTGESLFFLSDASRERAMCGETIKFLNMQWSGVDLFAQHALLWGARFDAPAEKSLANKLRLFFRPLLFLSSYDLSESVMAEYARKLNDFRVEILTSYPSPLEHFARFCLKKSIKISTLRAIVCSAEQLFDHQRELFERAFSVPVFNRYGCREFADIAMECEMHNGLHIMSGRVFMETIREDGSHCETGEVGEIVVTDLDNYAMPFVRYKIGDLGSLTDRKCDCGRGLPLMEKIQGRSFDLVRTPSGRTISGTFWTILTRYVSEDITAFQVKQQQPESITLFLQMHDRHLSYEEENVLRKEINKAAPDLIVNIEYVNQIPLTRSGKRRFVIGISTNQSNQKC